MTNHNKLQLLKYKLKNLKKLLKFNPKKVKKIQIPNHNNLLNNNQKQRKL